MVLVAFIVLYELEIVLIAFLYVVFNDPCVSKSHKRECTMTPCFLPRKEVIQPHLPIRLPCYDFTPITDPTFDS